MGSSFFNPRRKDHLFCDGLAFSGLQGSLYFHRSLQRSATSSNADPGFREFFLFLCVAHASALIFSFRGVWDRDSAVGVYAILYAAYLYIYTTLKRILLSFSFFPYCRFFLLFLPLLYTYFLDSILRAW